MEVPKNLIRVGITFALSFGLAKGLSFVAALALPRLVDGPTYGVLELALSIGGLGCAVVGLGAHTAAARIYLIDQDARAKTILAWQCLWLAAIGLCGAAATWLGGLGTDYVICTGIIGLFALQFYGSTYTRMCGLIHLSGWFDNIAILGTSLIAILLVLAWPPATQVEFAVAMAAMAAIAVALSVVVLARTGPGDVKHLLGWGIRLGVPMMMYSVVTLAIFGTPRIAIAKALTLTDVANFSLCARLALGLVFVHQVLSTGLFRQLYQMDNARVGPLMAIWFVALSVVAFAMAVAGHYGAAWLVIGTDTSAQTVAALLPVVLVQTVLWIFNANLEFYINRELVSGQASAILAILLGLGMAAGYLLYQSGLLTLLAIVYVYIALMAAALISQMLLLSRKGFSFTLCFAALPAAASPLLVLLI